MIRTFIVVILCFFLIFFWGIPVAILSGISNLETLSKIPILGFLAVVIEWNPVISGLIQGFLPTLALLLFMLLLIPIIRKLIGIEALRSLSAEDKGVYSVYFLFLIFNVLLVSLIAGSIFRVLEDMIQNPSSIPTLLALSIPAQGIFFINYVLVAAWIYNGMSLFRPVELIIRFLKRKYICKSKRDFRELDEPKSYGFAPPFAKQSLIFAICIVYSTLCPLILIFGLIYYALSWLSTSYNLIYVYKNKYESNGMWWPAIFKRLMFGLVLNQIALIGIFGVFQFIPGAIISAVLAIVSVLFWNYCIDKFSPADRYGFLEQSSTLPLPYKLRGAYVQPVMKELKFMETQLEEQEGIPKEVTYSPSVEDLELRGHRTDKLKLRETKMDSEDF
eukprot:TRINITY_DN4957_c0_g1_i1.p1 TRINITY_DN4957_c0_g1~~TRINITY_DN4957_c0_g1_i1.p1  ORF type:complete len:389 (-),score=40.50 TRINITY_DN4957_c0_g1_i1:27-1193(-)